MPCLPVILTPAGIAYGYLSARRRDVGEPAALLGLGGMVGFLSGVFGVGGGFLMTPLLIFIGIPPAVAVGTEAAADPGLLDLGRHRAHPPAHASISAWAGC